MSDLFRSISRVIAGGFSLQVFQQNGELPGQVKLCVRVQRTPGEPPIAVDVPIISELSIEIEATLARVIGQAAAKMEQRVINEINADAPSG